MFQSILTIFHLSTTGIELWQCLFKVKLGSSKVGSAMVTLQNCSPKVSLQQSIVIFLIYKVQCVILISVECWRTMFYILCECLRCEVGMPGFNNTVVEICGPKYIAFVYCLNLVHFIASFNICQILMCIFVKISSRSIEIPLYRERLHL